MGLGIHGEPGAFKAPLQPVDEIVAQVAHLPLLCASSPLLTGLDIGPNQVPASPIQSHSALKSWLKGTC
jgi:dihydroxyacetone kinase